MLLEVMREVSNFFNDQDIKETAEFTIESGRIELTGEYNINSYIAITGSVLNDFVYKIIEREDSDSGYIYELDSAQPLEDEKFTGAIYPLKIPRGFLILVDEIKANIERTPQTAFVSERFADYSYSLATGKDGLPASWQQVFRGKLHFWRKPRNWSGVRI